MNSAALITPQTALPWSSSATADKRFYTIAAILLAVMLVIGTVIPLIDVPEKTREERKKLPPQLARVVLEEKKLPEPKPPEPIEKPKVVEKPKPVPKPKKAEEATPEQIEQARDEANKSGVLQFQDELAAMRDAFDLSEVEPSSALAGESTAREIDRSVIANQTRATSGGVNVAALSRDTGGVAMAGRESTTVESDFDQAAIAAAEAKAGTGRTQAARSEQDVRQVMERNKGAIFAIYNRALRKDPTLQGKFTVKIEIDASGVVNAVSLVFSELGDKAIETKLINRIRLINFGAANVASTTLNYTFDFLPR